MSRHGHQFLLFKKISCSPSERRTTLGSWQRCDLVGASLHSVVPALHRPVGVDDDHFSLGCYHLLQDLGQVPGSADVQT